MENKKTIFISFIIALALIINAVIIGNGIQRFKKEDRSISVKGFSEREVKSDLALWTISYSVAENDLMVASLLRENTKNKIISFLNDNSIKDNEIMPSKIIVTDKKAQQFNDYNSTNNFRYIITESIEIRSDNVDNIQKVSRKIDEILKMGIVLNSNAYSRDVRYIYTGLNKIKPQMLIDATKNANNAALQFANESKSKLGKLKKANQGLFTIEDRDASNIDSQNAEYYISTSDIYKKVRVVVNIEYSIE